MARLSRKQKESVVTRSHDPRPEQRRPCDMELTYILALLSPWYFAFCAYIIALFGSLHPDCAGNGE